MPARLYGLGQPILLCSGRWLVPDASTRASYTRCRKQPTKRGHLGPDELWFVLGRYMVFYGGSNGPGFGTSRDQHSVRCYYRGGFPARATKSNAVGLHRDDADRDDLSQAQSLVSRRAVLTTFRMFGLSTRL